MKSRETLIRLKKFQVDEKRRRVTQIEGMIADFQRMAVELEREIQTEQDRAGINDPAHFAYPTYAKAAIQRRENLTRSADELRIQLEDAKSLLSEAFEELKKVELLDERDQARGRAEESAREQADLDSIGLMRARLGGAIALDFAFTVRQRMIKTRAARSGFLLGRFAAWPWGGCPQDCPETWSPGPAQDMIPNAGSTGWPSTEAMGHRDLGE
jgi:flagellar protein FliJ